MEQLLKHLGLQSKSLPVVGGDINQTYRVTDGKKDYFLKYHPNVDKVFFEAEAAGLKKLATVVKAPQVYQVGNFKKDAYLLQEWIEPGEGDQRDLAQELVKLHQVKAETFGWSQDNFIGLFPQYNQGEANWWDFYFEKRLEVQIEFAKQRNRWTQEREKNYRQLKKATYEKWANLSFEPSLLHGDFWSGNTFFDTEGQPVFVDPAVYFGHRELDIAMSQLFGGFRPEFLTTYQEIYPLAKDWEERLLLYQLYYLLVHLNIFGESYGESVDRILGGK